MKSIIAGILLTIAAATTTLASDRTTIYEGFNASIESETDSMTDRKIGLLFIHFGAYYIAIYDHQSFKIWPGTDKLIFADNKNNLIRPSKSNPIRLIRTYPKGGLTTANKTEAAKIIRALVNGEEVKFRYEDFPGYETNESIMQNKAAGFLYTKAAAEFGWKNLGQKNEIPKADISTYISKDANGEPNGYFSNSVLLNDQVQLSRGDRKWGGAVFAEFGFPLRVEAFGFNGKNWLFKPNILREKMAITIKDKDGNTLYQGNTPTYDMKQDSLRGSGWPDAENAARAAWKAGPFGTLTIKSNRESQTSLLYGFQELWQWGIENAGLPKISE